MKKIAIIILIGIVFLFACDNSSADTITLSIYDSVSNKFVEKDILANTKYNISELLPNDYEEYNFLGFS